jgi:hypothetical protein
MVDAHGYRVDYCDCILCMYVYYDSHGYFDETPSLTQDPFNITGLRTRIMKPVLRPVSSLGVGSGIGLH